MALPSVDSGATSENVYSVAGAPLSKVGTIKLRLTPVGTKSISPETGLGDVYVGVVEISYVE